MYLTVHPLFFIAYFSLKKTVRASPNAYELSVLKENGCADSVYKIDLERENLLDVLGTIKSR